MILFISSWHLVNLLGVFLGFSAFLGLVGILWLLAAVYKQVERENDSWEQQRRERRSAAAKRGHETRRAKLMGTVPEQVIYLEGPDDALVGEDQ